jgi:hypothetical protein
MPVGVKEMENRRRVSHGGKRAAFQAMHATSPHAFVLRAGAARAPIRRRASGGPANAGDRGKTSSSIRGERERLHLINRAF